MPTEPFTAADIEDSRMLLELLFNLEQSGGDDDEILEALLLYAAEPLRRTLKQDIGPERLSIARLQREAAARGCDVDDASVTTYIRFGFRLDWLPAVVQAFDLTEKVETDDCLLPCFSSSAVGMGVGVCVPPLPPQEPLYETAAFEAFEVH